MKKHHSPAALKLGFNIHAIVFILSIIAMVAINVVIGPPWWVVWPLIGWGVGLVMHWWFGPGPGRPRPITAKTNDSE